MTATRLSFLLVLLPSAVPAQDLVTVREADVCRDCSIHLEKVVSLRDPDGRAFLSSPVTVTRAASGDYLVVTGVAQHGIAVFSPAGRFVRRVGGDGDGPGEFRSIMRLSVGPGDSIFAWDPGTIRMTVLTPSLDYARDFRTATPTGRVIVSGSMYFGTGIVSGTSTEALPLQLFDSAGTMIRAFGGDDGDYGPGLSDHYRRSLAGTADGGIWSGRFTEYVLEQWDSLGSRISGIRREAPWFPAHTRADPAPDGPDDPPASVLVAIGAPSPGTLLTMCWVADPQWKDAVTTVVLQNRPRPGVRQEDRGRYRDTVLELIDAGRARVLGRLRVDELFTGLAAPDEVYRYEESAAGEPVIHIYRVVLERG